MPILWPAPIQKVCLHLDSLSAVVNELSQWPEVGRGHTPMLELSTILLIHLVDAELLPIERVDVIKFAAISIGRFKIWRDPVFHIIASDITKMLAFLKWVVPQRDGGLFWSRLTRGCAPQACPDVHTGSLDHLQAGVHDILHALASEKVKEPTVLLQHLRGLGVAVPSVAVARAESNLISTARRRGQLDEIIANARSFEDELDLIQTEDFWSWLSNEFEELEESEIMDRTRLSMLRWLHNESAKRFQFVAKAFVSWLDVDIARRLAEFAAGPRCFCETCLRLETAQALQSKSEVTGVAIASGSYGIDARTGGIFASESISEILLERDCLQEVVHAEPAAFRDEELLALQADHDWATHVEQRLHVPRAMDASQSALLAAVGSVFILRFRGDDTQAFRKALLSGQQLHPCRDALQRNGHTCVLSSDALIFVHPEQFGDALEALSCHTLHPFSVIIARGHEYLLHEVLLKMHCKKRPLEKKKSLREVSLSMDDPGVAHEHHADDAQASADGAEMVEWISCEDRTFLCVAPKLQSPQSVVQSTTEAVYDVSESHYAYYRGVNPRRYDTYTMD